MSWSRISRAGSGRRRRPSISRRSPSRRDTTRCCSIDADRQASSAEWLEERPIEGVTVVEAPSERTLTRAMGRHEGIAIVDTPPGDERLVQSAINSADAVVIPTRAGGVEYPRVVVTLGMIPAGTPRGVVIAAARLGTNDLEETIAWWKSENVPVWGVDPRTGRHRRRARGAPLPRWAPRVRIDPAPRTAEALKATRAPGQPSRGPNCVIPPG